MKLTLNKLSLVIVTILVTAGCTPTFPFIDSLFISPFNPESITPQVVPIDGSTLLTNDLTQIDLSTGEEHYLYGDFITDEWRKRYSIDRISFFPNENMAIVETRDTQEKFLTGLPVYKLDFSNKTISDPLDIKNIHDPSPFGKRIIANSTDYNNGSWQVFDLTTNTKIPLLGKTSRYEKEDVHASENYLWSKETNLPVANLILINPFDIGGDISPQVIGIYPVIGDTEGDLAVDETKFNQIYQSDPPDDMIDARFSPDGIFILATKWICNPSDPKQCSRYDLGSDDQRYDGSVTDTALILINWRTGEVKELIRLSQVDPSNVIGLSTEWSADGSTILVWRKEASPVVIKMK